MRSLEAWHCLAQLCTASLCFALILSCLASATSFAGSSCLPGGWAGGEALIKFSDGFDLFESSGLRPVASAFFLRVPNFAPYLHFGDMANR